MMRGFTRAIVRQNDDPERLGRVRVEYPQFPETGETPSEWAELCVPYASKTAGLFFLPEVGDEVLVFVGEDPDRPLIFGSIYSKQHRPPGCGREGEFNDNARNDLKYVGTRSGHVLAFDDSDSKRGVVLRDRDHRKVEILSSENKIVLSSESNEITLGPDSIVIVNKNGDQVTVAPNEIRIKSQSVKIEAATSVELGTGASEALIKGQAFMALFNAHSHTSGMAGSPTSPPMAPMTPAQLSTKVKTA